MELKELDANKLWRDLLNEGITSLVAIDKIFELGYKGNGAPQLLDDFFSVAYDVEKVMTDGKILHITLKENRHASYPVSIFTLRFATYRVVVHHNLESFLSPKKEEPEPPSVETRKINL